MPGNLAETSGFLFFNAVMASASSGLGLAMDDSFGLANRRHCTPSPPLHWFCLCDGRTDPVTDEDETMFSIARTNQGSAEKTASKRLVLRNATASSLNSAVSLPGTERGPLSDPLLLCARGLLFEW